MARSKGAGAGGAKQVKAQVPAPSPASREDEAAQVADDADGDGERRTRGGWVPAGTAAGRRANHATRGTERGRKTRQAILDAARRVFERHGYFDANIDDIVTEAGVARGTFYTYFPSKLHIFRVLASQVGRRVTESVTSPLGHRRLNPIAALDRANRRYIRVYRENAAMYGLLEQLATIDDVVHQERLESHQAHIRRVENTIRRWQNRGVADPEVEPFTTAAALVSMTSNLCYWAFVGGDEFDEEQFSMTVTDIWIRAVDLRSHPNEGWLAAVAD